MTRWMWMPFACVGLIGLAQALPEAVADAREPAAHNPRGIDLSERARLAATGAGTVIISEVLYDPEAVDDESPPPSNGEWVELHNPGTSPVDVQGWSLISTSGTFTLSASLVIPPGGYALLASESDLGDSGLGITADAVWPGAFDLDNTSDTLELRDGAAATVSILTYDESGGWPVGVGASIQLAPTLLDERYVEIPEGWCLGQSAIGGSSADLGTPGEANEACAGIDGDGDGHFTEEEDCDDSQPLAHADLDEVPDDGIDNDCDGIELYPIINDPADDSTYSASNELTGAYIGWDLDTLVFAFDYTIETNGAIYYFDLGVDGGETDFNSGRGYGGAFPAEIVHDRTIELMVAFYGAGSPGLFDVTNGGSSDITNQATTLERSANTADGSPGTVLLRVPWSVVYGLGGSVPSGATLGILGGIRGQNNNDGFGDLAPDVSGSPVSSHREVVIDGDGDGIPDLGVFEDGDGDGFTPDGGDCDDTSGDTFPGADEICDDADNDCDTTVDESPTDPETFYADADGDGARDPGDSVMACAAPAGYLDASADVDCDDADPLSYPGAEETCDEADNDCDTTTDEDATDATTYYADGDSDGQGDPGDTLAACAQPAGYVLDDTDCDDTRDDVNPGAAEVCDDVDNDCNGEIDEPEAVDASTFYRDSDGDTYGDPDNSVVACDPVIGFVSNSGDCDDDEETTNPDGTEVCDGADNDCNTAIDDGATDAQTYYPDGDGDGTRSASGALEICTPPGGYLPSSAPVDCDDEDPDNYPGNPEVCDGQDNNCNGASDEPAAVDAQTFFEDADGDGFGDDGSTTDACALPNGYAVQGGDCNDAADDIYPEGPELCDGRDNDCDDTLDEGFDADGDGTVDCVDDDDDGQSEDEGDCDDGDDAIFTGNTEVCDTKDNDCDGDVDEGVQSTFYRDADGDSFGALGSPRLACAVPAGYVVNSADCDDTDEDINPSADEVCDDVDNDCDATIDEPDAVDAPTWYADDDGDGFGDAGDARDSCKQPTRYVSNDDDCNDGDATLNPQTFWYLDGDSDNFGSDARSTQSCEPPPFSVRSGGDCDDFNPSIYPGATEVCDAADNNCNGTIDEGFDGDGDGVTTCASDCDDGDPDVYPAAPLLCDGKDNNCDGEGDFEEGFDVDGDGFLDAARCDEGADCNDNAADVYPGADEFCDGIDSNCDGEGDSVTFDVDGDGHLGAFEGCPAGGTGGKPADDCNDADGDVYPGAPLLCDRKDNDCNGSGDLAEGFDQDGDGHLDDASCDHGDDCDDSDPTTYTGAGEVCELDGDPVDNDCDGTVEDQYDDTDGDGLSACPEPGQEPDCNDNDPNVYPGAPEICDLKDSNCDGVIPANEKDVDRDGFPLCSLGGSTAVDCDDTNASAYPGNPAEVCDLADNDCDASVDEGVQQTFFLDSDGDGTGDPTSQTQACTRPDGYVRNANDCDDSDPTAFTGNTEVCDAIDNDCDGAVDERFDADSIGGPDCTDFDGDGFSENDGDCDDVSIDVYPGAAEDPVISGNGDGDDNDCDGKIDEGTSRYDDDGDGFCELDGQGVCVGGLNGGDCDDGDADINPFNPELAGNEVDENCDGTIEDVDGDGFCAEEDDVCTGDRDPGDCNDADPAINPAAEDIPGNTIDENCDDLQYDLDGDGVGTLEGDCDDTDPSRSPNLPELAGDDFDENCDGVAEDVDDDGFCAAGAEICTEGRGTGDCDDADPAINPGTPEIPANTVDENCDGTVEDVDGDGYCAEGAAVCTGDRVPGDCDDLDESTSPGAEDLSGDTLDQDCDGTPYDIDGDGYGLDGDNPDCDDEDEGRYPGLTEIPYDGIDQDCDGADLIDVDGDGYSGEEAGGLDCDDADPSINPEAEDVGGDAIDQNCDGDAYDLDGDGVDGDDVTGEGEDCNDNDPSISPEMLEVCGNTVDENCDGDAQLTCDDEDLDLDGQSPDDGDCNDDDPEIFQGAIEVCGDGVDNNCNQLTDEGCEEAGFFTVCDVSGKPTDRGSLWGLLALLFPVMVTRTRRLMSRPTARGE